MAIMASKAAKPNPDLVEIARKGANNLVWLEPHVKAGGAAILLLGGKGIVDFRLRVAQSRMRDDVSPSHWSHCALLLPAQEVALPAQKLYEISLEPDGGFGFPPPRNAVQEATLHKYANGKKWPNIALLHLPVQISAAALEDALDRFRKQRTVLDAVQLLLAWLSYAWGTGDVRNPMQDGLGMPSSAMLEIVLGAQGFDLTPGLESRSSCPEAI